jgi:putative membrane protein
MRKTLSLMTGVALALTVQLAAQPQDRQPTTPPQGGYGSEPGQPSQPKQPAAPKTPTQSQSPAEKNAATGMNQAAPAPDQFLMDVSRDNRAEVDLGQLAQTKAANAQVKAYGRMLASDHAKANTEVNSMARTKNVTLPAELSAEQKSLKEQLTSASGGSFDRQYVDAMVKDHQKAIALFEKASTSSDAQVKAFATKTLPTLRHHLEEAQRLQKTVGEGAMGSGK